MDISARHRDAQSRFLTLIEGAGVAPPNAIEYGAGSMTFYWYEPKLAVIVELDESSRGENRKPALGAFSFIETENTPTP